MARYATKIIFPALLIALAVVWATRATVARSEPAFESALLGKPAPQIDLVTLAGERAVLADAKGKVVVLDFWATWCPPCVAGLPSLRDIANQYKAENKDVVVWAMNAAEEHARVKQFVERTKLNDLTVVMADIDTFERFGISPIPVQMVIDRTGVITYVRIFTDLEKDKADLKTAIEAALRE
jgi:thiol-disulfide isomerase/thioredoxin